MAERAGTAWGTPCRECGRGERDTKFRQSSERGRLYRRRVCSRCIESAAYAKIKDCPRKRASTVDSQMKHRYGIRLDGIGSMLDRQGEKCLCCEREILMPGSIGTNRLLVANVDHCHETGKVRGLLCGDCNRGIGLLGDNLIGVMRAVKYLTDYEKESHGRRHADN